MSERVHNFGAGPAALPLPVLERVREELLDFEGSGMSVLEMSHRGPVYGPIHRGTVERFKRLLGLGEDHAVLFMGGGARTQFGLVPMNLAPPGGPGGDYLTTGRWSEMAFAEAGKAGPAREIWSSAGTGHDRVPEPGSYEGSADAAYLHYTSNNTVAGTQYPAVPRADGVPLVCDMSSDFLSRPFDAAPFGLIYAGAQKNLGPAGVTVVVVRRDLLVRSRAELPDMLSYAEVAAKDSLLNTPPTFPIYVVGLVLEHLEAGGGLAAAAARNGEKARLLYAAIDGSGGFYRGHAQQESRSFMNVTFRLPSEDLESRFVTEAGAAGMLGLKGHRSVGGVRASLYNAVTAEAVRALVSFMEHFQEGVG